MGEGWRTIHPMKMGVDGHEIAKCTLCYDLHGLLLLKCFSPTPRPIPKQQIAHAIHPSLSSGLFTVVLPPIHVHVLWPTHCDPSTFILLTFLPKSTKCGYLSIDFRDDKRNNRWLCLPRWWGKKRTLAPIRKGNGWEGFLWSLNFLVSCAWIKWLQVQPCMAVTH